MQLDYHVVDVFTCNPLEGNPVAVFTDARELSEAAMQKIARELSLSETVFVLPPSQVGCDVRVRIFTPAREMKFAGHPTIGAAYVVRETGIVPNKPGNIVLEEPIGAIRVFVDAGDAPIIWLESPPARRGRVYDRPACAQLLGLADDDLLPNTPCQLLSSGNPNLFVALRDRDAVDRVALDSALFAALHADQDGPVCTFVFTPVAQGAYSRMFAPELGIVEDPATGSATGPLATFMMEHGLVGHTDGTRFISEQGTKLGRRSFLHVYVRGDYGSGGIHVGGQVAPIIRATMTLPDATAIR